MRFKLLTRLIPGVLLLAICLSFLPVQVPQARAAITQTRTPDACAATGGTYKGNPGSLAGPCEYQSNPAGSDPTQAAQNDTTAANRVLPKDDLGCNFSTAFNSSLGLAASICLTNVIYVFTVGIGSAFAYVAAFFFDLAIQLSLQSTAYALDFISTGWTLARDLANMAFLFILIYIAILVMLTAEDGNTMKTLVLVIVTALLVNFSFFFTRIVIDAGNLLSVQFYNAIPDGGALIGTTAANSSFGIGGNNSTLLANFTSLASGGQMKDLTYSVMQMMQLQGLFQTAGFQQFANSPGDKFLTSFISLTFLYLAAGALFWGLIVMFVAVGIKFLMRIVVLWFLIIASPLAFVAKAVPSKSLNISKKFNDWLEMLINHAFYPAGFMFVFFILSLFSNQLANGNALGGSSLINGIFSGLSGVTDANFVQIMAIAVANVGIRLGFVLAVMYVGLKASEYIGVTGAKFAQDFGNRVGGWFVNPLLSGASTVGRWAPGALYRQGVGGVAAKASDALKNSRWANQDTLVGRMGYRLRNRVVEPVAKSQLTDVAGSYRDKEKTTKDRQEDMKANLRTVANKERDEENKRAVSSVGTSMRATGTAAATDETRVRGFNKRELESLSASQLQDIAHLLSESQLKTVTDSDKYSDAEKDTVKNIAEPVIKAQKEIADTLRKASSALRVSATPVVNNFTTRGAQISLADITQMLNEVNAQKQTIRADIAANPTQNHGERNADLAQLHNMTNSLNELSRQVTRIQSVGARAGQVHHVT